MKKAKMLLHSVRPEGSPKGELEGSKAEGKVEGYELIAKINHFNET